MVYLAVAVAAHAGTIAIIDDVSGEPGSGFDAGGFRSVSHDSRFFGEDYPDPGDLGDYHYELVSGSGTASWTFTVSPGSYEVAATWYAYSNRAYDAPFSIWDGPTELGTYLVDQREAPDALAGGFVDGDYNWAWYPLDTVNVSGTTLKVELQGSANGYVMADAIRIAAVPEPSTLAALGGLLGMGLIGRWWRRQGK